MAILHSTPYKVLVSRGSIGYTGGRIVMVQGTLLAIQGVVLYTVLVLYREVLARDRGEYWLYRE